MEREIGCQSSRHASGNLKPDSDSEAAVEHGNLENFLNNRTCGDVTINVIKSIQAFKAFEFCRVAHK